MAKPSNGTKTARKKTPTSIDSASRKPLPVPPAAYKAEVHGDIEDQIRQRAYELYVEEGRQEGRDQEYWFRAEAEVRSRRSA